MDGGDADGVGGADLVVGEDGGLVVVPEYVLANGGGEDDGGGEEGRGREAGQEEDDVGEDVFITASPEPAEDGGDGEDASGGEDDEADGAGGADPLAGDHDDDGGGGGHDVGDAEYLEASVDPADMMFNSTFEGDDDEDGDASSSVMPAHFLLQGGGDPQHYGDEDEWQPPPPAKRGRGRPRGSRGMRGRGRGRGRGAGRPRMYGLAPPLPLPPSMSSSSSSTAPFKRKRGRPRRDEYATAPDGTRVLMGPMAGGVSDGVAEGVAVAEKRIRNRPEGSDFRRTSGLGACPFCRAPVVNSRHFRQHVDDKHSQNMTCDQCYFKTPFELVMSNHRFSSHGAGAVRTPLECPFCEYRVYQWARFRDHIARHDSEKGAVLPGGVTLTWGKREEGVKPPPVKPAVKTAAAAAAERQWGKKNKAFKVKTPERKICSMCEARFESESAMRSHLTSTHLSSGPPFSCPSCPFSTPVKMNLPQHFEICHRKISDYECALCDFSTYSRAYLRNHEKAQHEGKKGRDRMKNKKCPHCEYKTHTKYCLQDHIKRRHWSLSSEQEAVQPAGADEFEQVGVKSEQEQVPTMDQHLPPVEYEYDEEEQEGQQVHLLDGEQDDNQHQERTMQEEQVNLHSQMQEEQAQHLQQQVQEGEQQVRVVHEDIEVEEGELIAAS